MNYISQSPIHCSNGNLECVINCTNFHEKKGNGYMFKTNLVLILTKKGGESCHLQFSTQAY